MVCKSLLFLDEKARKQLKYNFRQTDRQTDIQTDRQFIWYLHAMGSMVTVIS